MLFYKYLLSYFIIFLIPFATISIIFYQMSAENLREEIIKSNTTNLEQVKNLTDTQTEELENIVTRISMDHRLSPYMFSHPYYSKEAIQELKNYQVNSSFINGLSLYFHDEDYIYSSSGTSKINTFIDNVYQMGKNKSRFEEEMKSVTKPAVQPIITTSKRTENKNTVISHLYPISSKGLDSYGTVMFFVKEKVFTNLIKTTLGDYSGNVYIFDGENKLLASGGKGRSLHPKTIKKLSSEKSGVAREKIQDEDYSIVTVRSDVNNWTFVTAMPTKQFYSKMSNLKTTILVILTTVALLGIGMIIFITLKQYKPIQSLSLFLNTKQRLDYTKQTKKDELTSIREKVELIHEDREELQKKIKVQQPFVRDQFLLKLLKGDVKVQQELKYVLEDLKFTFNGNHFFVILVSFKSQEFIQDSLEKREEIVRLLTEVSFHNDTGYGVELINDNGMALIVSTKDDIEFESLKQNRCQFITELTREIHRRTKSELPIGVGEIYKGIEWTNRSFIEANAALEYRHLNLQGGTTYFEDITQDKEKSLWYPAESQLIFVQSLKQGDQIVAKESLKNILNNLMKKEVSIHMLRSMCFDVINTVLKSISDLELIYSVDSIKNLVEFQSIDDLEKKVHVLIDMICEEVEKRKESHNNVLRDNVLDYIHRQFKSHELSLEETAEKLQLSSSYLSRFMKEQTGTTFTQYVWGLRNEEFKRQLKETTKAIKDIVTDIGYIDVANFTRKFKKEEGITPGQYRKNNTYDSKYKSEKAL